MCEGLKAVKDESLIHLNKIEELEQKLFDLSGEIAGGRHVPPGVRVLSLRNNPEQQWVDLRQAAMDRLRAENEALLKRLKELEESGVSLAQGGGQMTNNDLVPRESWETLDREKTELEAVLKQKEKRLLRLQQVLFMTSKSTCVTQPLRRSSSPKAPSLKTPSRPSLVSNSPFIPMAKSASRPYSISTRRLSSNPPLPERRCN